MDSKQIYNADCVGVYNILRLYLKKRGLPFPEAKGLPSLVKVSVQAVKRPTVAGA